MFTLPAMYAFPATESVEPGVEVPMPMRPAFVATNVVPVDEPITNVGFVVSVVSGLMESVPHGVAVPMANWFAAVVKLMIEVPSYVSEEPDVMRVPLKYVMPFAV
jgi:hypothetical protein